MTSQERYQAEFESLCGGPCIHRKPLVRPKVSALDRMAVEQVEATKMYEELSRLGNSKEQL